MIWYCVRPQVSAYWVTFPASKYAFISLIHYNRKYTTGTNSCVNKWTSIIFLTQRLSLSACSNVQPWQHLHIYPCSFMCRNSVYIKKRTRSPLSLSLSLSLSLVCAISPLYLSLSVEMTLSVGKVRRNHILRERRHFYFFCTFFFLAFAQKFMYLSDVVLKWTACFFIYFSLSFPFSLKRFAEKFLWVVWKRVVCLSGLCGNPPSVFH